jgi:hypothetical protein
MAFHTSAVDSSTWAEETFGTAVLGDVRRTQRVVAMAARAAESPRGTVTGVFPTSAEREGAFRLLENPAVSHAAVTEAAMEASAVRCRAESLVYVAVDGSSLTLSDSAEKRELGRVGPQLFARGLLVMSALAVDANGAAVGLLDQQWWARDQPPAERRGERMKCRSWNFSERETRFWLEALMNSERRLRDAAPGTAAWYQLDRGVSDLLCKLTSGGQTSFEENVELNEHTRPSDWTLPMYLGVSDCQKKQLEDCFVVWERTTLSQRLSEL